MTEKKPTRSELKREAILQAAKRAFQERGVHNTSMDELAAQAEVSKRTVYNHFNSKEALIVALMEELWQQASQCADGVYQAGIPLHTQLKGLIEAEVAMICSREYIELNRVAFDHFFHQPEALREQMDKFSALETGITRWLKAAQADGRLQDLDIEIGSKQIHSLIKGSCFWPQLMQVSPLLNQRERRALAERTAAMFLSRYGV